MKEIPLTQGQVALVDDEDFDRLMQWKWTALRKVTKHYVHWKAYRSQSTNGKSRPIYMHREIVGAKTGETVDHIDSDGLNNQRHNLRKCNHAENCRNRRVRSEFGLKNIAYDARREGKNPWGADIKMAGRAIRLGSFATAKEAAQAYDIAAKELFGQFAHLNFPDTPASADIRSRVLTILTDKRRFRTKSGFRGVYFSANSKSRPYRASIFKHGRDYLLGTFATAEEAARAYDAKARELSGTRAILNFPNELHGQELMKSLAQYPALCDPHE